VRTKPRSALAARLPPRWETAIMNKTSTSIIWNIHPYRLISEPLPFYRNIAMPSSCPIINFIRRSSIILPPNHFNKYPSINKQKLGTMASQLHCSLEKAPASRPHRVCSIVPPHLLADILRHDGHTEPTRAAVHNTLRHLYKLQECRKARIENAHALFSSPTTEGKAPNYFCHCLVSGF
jgi:hypothetical protein